MDKILEKHLSNALVLIKSDLNISILNENIIPYHSCIIEENKYKISTDNDNFTCNVIGYWKDKPIINYNKTKYAILENSKTIVKLKSLNVTDDKIEKVKILKEELTATKVPNQNQIIKDLEKISPQKIDDKNSVISAYVDSLKKNDKQTKEKLKDDVKSTIEYINTDKPNNLEEQLFSLLDTKKDDPRIKRLFSYYSEQTKKEVHEINEKYSKQYLAKILETSGGGGTSNNAVNYSDGGTINGDLTITSNLSVVGQIYGIKSVYNIGNNIDTNYVIDHNLNTKDLVISIYDSEDEMVLAFIKNINLNQTLISFSTPVENMKVVIIR